VVREVKFGILTLEITTAAVKQLGREDFAFRSVVISVYIATFKLRGK
jgi:hypothetical protein